MAKSPVPLGKRGAETLKPKVLIVDDEQSMCELIEADLRFSRFRAPLVHLCRTGIRYVLSRADYDVVLTDLKMPGTDGIPVLLAGSWPTGLTSPSSS